MLVLSRKVREVIQIEHCGEMIEVIVQSFRGNAVRIGLTGPKTFNIRRKELLGGESKEVTDELAGELADEDEVKVKVVPQTFSGPPQPLTTARIKLLKQRKLVAQQEAE